MNDRKRITISGNAPSGRELFRGDFRAVRQQTAVFFADTHTHTHIYIYI